MTSIYKTNFQNIYVTTMSNKIKDTFILTFGCKVYLSIDGPTTTTNLKFVKNAGYC